MKRLKYYKEQWEEFCNGIDFDDSEKTVIALIRRGWYLEDIGAELHISRRTVGRRCDSICDKIEHYKSVVSEKSDCHIKGV